MKSIKNVSITKRIAALILVVTILGISLLYIQIQLISTETVKQATENQMLDTVASRTKIINNYISEIEEYMTGFALSTDAAVLLKNPDNVEYQQKAQEYIKSYAAVQGCFEGLYIADLETKVLAHTSDAAVGIICRTGDSKDWLLKNS